jgi:hypothetical protein
MLEEYDQVKLFETEDNENLENNRDQIMDKPKVMYNTYTTSQYKYAAYWRRAFFKIKARRALNKMKEDIILYGTSLDKSEIDKTKVSLARALEMKYGSNNKQKYISKDPDFPKYLIHPESRFKQIWNLCICFLLLYTALIMPYRVAFMENVYWDSWTTLETIMDFLFIFDIFINLFSSYPTSEGHYEIRLYVIMWKYIKSWMILDIFASIPFGPIEANDDEVREYVGSYNDILRLIRLPRLYRLLRLSKLLKVISGKFFERVQDWLNINTPKAKLIVFVITVAVVVHVVACFWYYASRLQGFGPESWVVSYGILDKGIGTKYLCSVYWAVTTLGTIGYGDITPENDLERFMAMVWMLFGVGFYTYTIGSLSSLISSIDVRESALTQKLHMINTFAQETGISKELQRSLRNAIKYNSSATGMSWTEKIQLFEEMPKNLKYKIAINMFHKAAETIHYFRTKDPSFIATVMPLLKPLQTKDDEVIYDEGEYADEMFFIVKGRVNLVYGEAEVIYKSYLKGSYFGEIEIIKKIGRIDKVISSGVCQILALAKDVMISILEKHPKEEEEMKRTAEEREKRHRQSKEKLKDLLSSARKRYSDVGI